MTDTWHALIPSAPPDLVWRDEGPLRPHTFVVKDNIDVAGVVTGGGSPALRETGVPAAASAVVVDVLAGEGAVYVGRARCDELAFSLGGVNALDGTPDNPAAPGHTCGGSSSGCAAAVAGGIADIGLGTDTAGSIRVPAAYCGLVGFRPTHGRVSLDGVLPLAPSYDTVGWLTRTGDVAADVGRALLGSWDDAAPPRALVVVADLLPTDPADAAVVTDTARRWAAALGAELREVTLGGLDKWAAAFHVLRSVEAWAVHGEWLRRDRPALSAAVADRLRAGERISTDEFRAAARIRDELLRVLDAAIAPGTALLVPAAAVRAPSLEATEEELDVVRRDTLRLTTIAALAGAPSVAVPGSRDGGLPFGVALIGRPGDDEALLAAAAAFAR